METRATDTPSPLRGRRMIRAGGATLLMVFVVAVGIVGMDAIQQRTVSLALSKLKCELSFDSIHIPEADSRLENVGFHLANALSSVTICDYELLDAIIVQLEKIGTVNHVEIRWSGGCGLCQISALKAKDRLLQQFPNLNVELVQETVAPIVA